ncbi:MAG: PilX N-terminal domain-containing pilus assembly protein [Pseudomonadota bacterium]
MQMSSRFQTGAALLVSLVILLILSIIGISAMRGGLLQTLMAANTQQLYIAQNAADGAVETMYFQTNDEGFTNDSMLHKAISGSDVSFAIDESGSLAAGNDVFMDGDRERPIIQANASVEYVGCSAPGGDFGSEGFCLQQSVGPGKGTICNVFRITGNGTVSDVSAQTELWISAAVANCS